MKELIKRIKIKKMKKHKYIAHKTAIIETKLIGSNTRIWANVHIMKGAKIGANCNIGDGCFIETNVKIDDNVVVKNNVSIWDGVEIKQNVFIGPSVTFTNDLKPRVKNLLPGFKPLKTLIKEGASLGANSTVLANVTVGSYAMVAAGSVVTKDVPDFALVRGLPARMVSLICVCTEKLNPKPAVFFCKKCKRRYKKNNKTIVLIK